MNVFEEWLIYGGPMPGFKLPEVPMPEGVYVCMKCKQVNSFWEHLCESCDAKAQAEEDGFRGQ